MNEEEDRDTVLFTVSAYVAQAAIAQVASCELCNPDEADWPFEAILDRVMLFSGAHTDYFYDGAAGVSTMQGDGDRENTRGVGRWNRARYH